MSFAGKSVLITGGGSGIGAATAYAFAEAGATVWITGRSVESLSSVAARHPAIKTAICDVTDETSVAGTFETAGPQDIVIANAGIAASMPLVKTTQALWDQILAVNLTGVFLTFRAAMTGLTKDDGRLIAIASIAGLKGAPYISAYTASKHGVVGLVRSLAAETAKTGITVNAICPGYVDTPMTDRTVANISDKTGKSTGEARALIDGLAPKGRMVRPDEVAAAALYLAGDGAGMITGETLTLSGGER